MVSKGMIANIECLQGCHLEEGCILFGPRGQS